MFPGFGRGSGTESGSALASLSEPWAKLILLPLLSIALYLPS